VRRLRQALTALSVAVAVPCFLGMGVVGPFFLNTLFIGLGAVGPPSNYHNPHPDPRYLEGNGIELALLLQALFVTSCTLVWLASQTRALRQSRKLAILAFLPLSDAGHRRQVLRVSLWSHALAMAWFTFFGYAYWARAEDFTIGGRLAIAALLVLQGGASAALLTWLQGRFSALATGITATVLFLLLFFGSSLAFLARPYVEGWTWIGMALTPAGWVNAAFYYGLVRGNPAGWLWLLPAAALVAVACRRARLPYTIREFRFLARGEAEGIPEECSKAFTGPQSPLLPAWREIDKRETPLPEADAVRRIRAGALADTAAGRRPGWVERFVLRRLSTRDRAILDCLFIPTLRFWTWTWWWNWLALATAVLLALLAGPWFTQIFPEAGPFIAFLCLLVYMLYFCGPGITTGRVRIFPNNWLPIGDAEVSRLLWKLHLRATILVAPFFLTIGLAAGWRIYGQPLFGLLVAAVWLYTALAVFPFRLILSIGTEAVDEIQVLRRMPLLLLLGCAGTVVLGAVIGALQWQGPWLTAVSAGVLPLLSFGIWYVYRRSVARWRGDWLPSRSG
jgi:hypothetical protein